MHTSTQIEGLISPDFITESGSYLTMEQLHGFTDESINAKIIGVHELAKASRELVDAMIRSLRKVDTESSNYLLECQRMVISTFNVNLMSHTVQLLLASFRIAQNDTSSIMITTLYALSEQSRFFSPQLLEMTMFTSVGCLQHYAQAKPKNFMYS